MKAASANLPSLKPRNHRSNALLWHRIVVGKYLILVDAQMNCQQLASDEALGAEAAQKALLVCVRIFVGDEWCHVDESTATVAALEVSSLAWLVAGHTWAVAAMLWWVVGTMLLFGIPHVSLGVQLGAYTTSLCARRHQSWHDVAQCSHCREHEGTHAG